MNTTPPAANIGRRFTRINAHNFLRISDPRFIRVHLRLTFFLLCAFALVALALSPSSSAQDTLTSPTPREARPSWTPPKVSVVPRMSTSAPSPESVTVHELVEQLTPFDVSEQADTGSVVRAMR